VQQPTDKPRVERTVQYARESFFRGRQYASLAAWREAAVTWCRDLAGERVHGTTGERPLAAFVAREQAALQPLPARAWERVQWMSARVQRDGHVRAASAWYSVPAMAVQRQVDVRLSARLVEIYDGTALWATPSSLSERPGIPAFRAICDVLWARRRPTPAPVGENGLEQP